VKFDVEGQGIAADGTVSTKIKGTQTLRSAGKEIVDNQPCRWIEMESEMSIESTRGPRGRLNEIYKLLIPESQLIKGKIPRDHVLKAYKGRSADTLKELDVKGDGEKEIQGLDEVFHAPLKQIAELPVATIETKQDKWKCAGFQGEDKSESLIFTTETRTNEKSPFGVVTYKYEKDRRRNNESLGMRTMTWRLVDFGKNPKIAAPNAD
jgi:hypothetical protein